MKSNQLVIVCSVELCDFSVNSVLNNSTQRHKGHKVSQREQKIYKPLIFLCFLQKKFANKKIYDFLCGIIY